MERLMLRKMRLCSLILFASLFVTACGQTGALYKSPDKKDNQKQEQQQPKKQSNKE
ncbi:LPS translocon maturation chaperone LptM [Shewanella psychrophila]